MASTDPSPRQRQATSEWQRLITATRNSLRGIGFAWRREPAFRMELVLLAVGTPLAAFMARSISEFLWLVVPLLLMPMAELLNTAVEITLDRISLEHHPMTGQAKDMGSAAVLFAMAIAILSWTLALGERLLGGWFA